MSLALSAKGMHAGVHGANNGLETLQISTTESASPKTW